MNRVPKAGDGLNTADFDMIMEAVQARRQNFPDEPPVMTLGLILFNIGDRFTSVGCVNGEWSGLKQDIPTPLNNGDLPKCPNGHVLLQEKGLRLGWVESE